MGSGGLPRMAVGSASLRTRRWSVQEWLGNEAVWSGLVARSRADSLFLSWDWLTNWWHFFGDALGQDPDILAFYRGADLVGLAPLYHRRLRRGGLLPTRSMQMMGLSWRDPETLISEYLDVIAAPDDLDAVRDACMRVLLGEPGWTEFVIGFTTASAQWRETYERCAASTPHYSRVLDRSVTYQADLSSGFAAYLGALRQSTRRSLWNLRRRLAVHGEVRLELLTESNLESGFEDLNRLHQLRWQKPAFSDERLAFHLRLARRLSARGELALSRLRVGGGVVSVLYDIRKSQRQYNIKLGFDPDFSSQISLGLIHLGYAMESAAERGIGSYDFLAGPGRTSDFKRLLSQVRRELSCVQMLRGPLVSSLYRWRDRVRQP